MTWLTRIWHHQGLAVHQGEQVVLTLWSRRHAAKKHWRTRPQRALECA